MYITRHKKIKQEYQQCEKERGTTIDDIRSCEIPHVLSKYTAKENGLTQYYILPVVPHEAVAEVSRIGHYRRD